MSSLNDSHISEDARLRLMAARIIAQGRWPYLSSLLFSLRITEASPDELSTMAVDRGWRMYYSPQFVMSETPETLATVVLHESLHCLYEHAGRFDSLNQPPITHPIWNIAGDLAINSVLEQSRMPWGRVEPLLLRDFESSGLDADLPTEGMFFRLLEQQEAVRCSEDCGSVTGGAARPYELPASDSQHPSVQLDHQQIVRDRVAQDVIGAARAGKDPGALLRWAEERLSPRLPWRRILAGFIRRDLAVVAGRRDYSYMRPSRRQQALRASGSTVVLPAMRQPAPPRVAVIVDTSGSISKSEFKSFVAEVLGIVKAAGVSTPVTVIACDAIAYPPVMVRSARDVAGLSLRGGGGTDLRVGLAAAAKLRPLPDVVVVFTDGETPWPTEIPYGLSSVIVALNGCVGSQRRSDVPEWCSQLCLPLY